MSDKPTKFIKLSDFLNPSRAYYTIDQPKHEISKVIHDKKKETDATLREMANQIKELYGPEIKTPHHNTIQSITSGGNYRIDFLLMLLDLLGKELVIVDRKPETEEFLRQKEQTDWKKK